jgi:hypothetical protein
MKAKDTVNGEEVEVGSMYKTVDNALDPEGSDVVEDEAIFGNNLTNLCIEDICYNSNIVEHANKYQFVHKKWKELYEFERFVALKEAIQSHLYKV